MSVEQVMVFQAKLTSHCVFQSYAVWYETFQNVRPALENQLKHLT